MESRGDDKLRSLLRRFQLQTPPPTFTGEVLKEIEAMADDKVYANASLKAVLQKNVSAQPSHEFTYKVLNKVREQPTASYQPIISKKAWALIVVFIFICLIVALSKGSAGSSGTGQHYYILVGAYLSNLTLRLIEPLFYSGVIILSAGLLLSLDYFIAKKVRSRAD
jgi:hypothetical protein